MHAQQDAAGARPVTGYQRLHDGQAPTTEMLTGLEPESLRLMLPWQPRPHPPPKLPPVEHDFGDDICFGEDDEEEDDVVNSSVVRRNSNSSILDMGPDPSVTTVVEVLASSTPGSSPSAVQVLASSTPGSSPSAVPIAWDLPELDRPSEILHERETVPVPVLLSPPEFLHQISNEEENQEKEEIKPHLDEPGNKKTEWLGGIDITALNRTTSSAWEGEGSFQLHPLRRCHSAPDFSLPTLAALDSIPVAPLMASFRSASKQKTEPQFALAEATSWEEVVVLDSLGVPAEFSEYCSNANHPPPENDYLPQPEAVADPQLEVSPSEASGSTACPLGPSSAERSDAEEADVDIETEVRVVPTSSTLTLGDDVVELDQEPEPAQLIGSDFLWEAEDDALPAAPGCAKDVQSDLPTLLQRISEDESSLNNGAAPVCQLDSSNDVPLPPLPEPSQSSKQAESTRQSPTIQVTPPTPAAEVPPPPTEAAPILPPPAPPQHKLPVQLHVYDVSQKPGVQWFNAFLAHRWSPIKFGGVFHVGVEILGKEWWFGACPFGTGVSWCTPLSQTEHHYRETLDMPECTLTEVQIGCVLQVMMTEYPGSSYHLLRRNCCHFAGDFCRRLGVGEVPAWLGRLADFGSEALSGLSGLEERVGVLQMSRSVLTIPTSNSSNVPRAIEWAPRVREPQTSGVERGGIVTMRPPEETLSRENSRSAEPL